MLSSLREKIVLIKLDNCTSENEFFCIHTPVMFLPDRGSNPHRPVHSNILCRLLPVYSIKKTTEFVPTWLACMDLIATRIAAISEVIVLFLASLQELPWRGVAGLRRLPAENCTHGPDSYDTFCILDVACHSKSESLWLNKYNS